MRIIILIFILIRSTYSFAQGDSAIFDKNFKLREGIYTSYLQILNNTPEFPDYKVSVDVNAFTGFTYIYFYDPDGFKHSFKDSMQTVFAVVQNGDLFLWFEKTFQKLVLVGSISTFIFQTKFDQSTNYAKFENHLYFYDIQSGSRNNFDCINLESIIQRDSSLYLEFSKLTKTQAKNQLYSFVLKYNFRNPIYIKKILDNH